MPLSQIFKVANTSFYDIPQNKILVKISEFIVPHELNLDLNVCLQ